MTPRYANMDACDFPVGVVGSVSTIATSNPEVQSGGVHVQAGSAYAQVEQQAGQAQDLMA